MCFLYFDKCPCTNKQTNKQTKKEIKEFCNLLEQNINHINQIARSYIKIMLGDVNAKVGKENMYKPTIGNESYAMKPTTTE
jgi:hypothetical protein